MVIELKLYDEENETKKTLRSTRVPWGLMKKAAKMQSSFKSDDILASLDEVMDVVAELFRGQATRQEIEEGASSDEIFTCFRCMIQGVTIEANRNFIKAVKAAAEEK